MINYGLILVLSQHPVFGSKLNVNSVELTESGNIRILGTPVAKVEEKRGVPADFISIIKLAESISDKSLMKDYSKKKTFAEFRKELTEDTMNLFIRPRIENTNRKILEIARRSDIYVFFRVNLSDKYLFEHLKIKVIKTPTACLFNFVKDEKGFRYYISLTNDEREISLQTEQAVIISEDPSIVLIGSEIHFVENIVSKKLVPFFTKGFIEVPARSEEVYLKSFVFKTMQQYETKITGFPVREITPEKKAVLSLEKGFHNELVLILLFVYNGQTNFMRSSSKKKEFWLEKKDGVISICRYERDKVWEEVLANKLLEEGLVVKSTNHYCCGVHDSPFSLIEWLNIKGEELGKHFFIEQHLDREYYTGLFFMEAKIDEKFDWFDVDIVVVAGDHKIPFKQFRKHILNGNKDFVLPDGKVLILPDDWFEKYRYLFKIYKDSGDFIQVKKQHTSLLQYALEGLISIRDTGKFKNVLELPSAKPAVPKEIKVELRSYQKEGFYWLAHLYEKKLGACLADDMGLGKTLQTITLIQYIYSRSMQKTAADTHGQLSLFDSYESALPASLVIAPTSLLHNWKNELQRFAPGLKVLVYTGSERLKVKDNIREFDRYQVIISSYGVIRNDIDALCNYSFQLIVLDESQYIKNHESLAYKSVIQLTSEHRVVLTGTPVENSLDDLWAQFNFINEGLLDTYHSFRNDFIYQITKEKNEKAVEQLKMMINPFMLRRTKEQVTPELPPLTQDIIYCSMTEKHQEAYDEEKNKIRNIIIEAREHPEIKKNNFIILSGLTKLRQLANHPRMADADYDADSGKFEQIIMSFESLKASHHKVLVFSSFVKHLNILAEKFDDEGWKYAMLTGETTNRESEIKRFKENDDISCFFISLKAGSTGLNLTEADYVFIIDPWWNPASEMQAFSRAHRIGQDKPVMVYRFITSETVEEKILRLQDAKKELFETFVNEANPLSRFDWDDIEQLL